MEMMNDLVIETAGSLRSTWGEGPIWWNDCLYYVDIETHRVVRFDPVSGEEQFWDVGQRVGLVVPRRDGGLLCAGDGGFFFLDESTGACSAIVDPETEKPDNRFNDGKCAPDGSLFAGSISLVKRSGDATLYRLSTDLSCSVAYAPVTNSNGIIWSLDGKICYYIDTPRRNILAFDYADGRLSNPRQVVDTSAVDASPDGMTIDADGRLWVAFCHGACVCCYDPETGTEIRRIDLPCLETTACAFGGADLSDLYVTTGIHKTEKEEHAGRLLVIKGLGIRGVNATCFAG
jgi:sugar lactone lactonase YvrE